MRQPAALRVELGRSRLAAAFVFVSHVATAGLVAVAPGNGWMRGTVVIAIGAHALWALRTCASRSTARAVVAVELSSDHRAILIERSGRRCEGVVKAQSYVGERLTTLVVRPDGARVSRAIAILPDMLPAEDLRRLRVLLRLRGVSA